MSTPMVILNNGLKIPVLGLGTWKSNPEALTKAVEYAIDIGYRHIDCAFIYQNEKEIGTALANKFKEGKVKREDIFITSKLWNTFHSSRLVERALRQSLENLKLDYLDSYLIHWPIGYKEEDKLFPLDSNGKMQFSNVNFLDTWKAMENLVEQGLVKSIGLSNFNRRQIESVLNVAIIRPAILQIECHPYLNQKKLIEFCKSKDIAVTAYSPLGSPDRPWAKPDDPKLLQDKKLQEVAQKYGKTTAQVLVRYQIQRGNITIPKSITTSRIKENFDIFNFELTADDMAYIDTFDCNGRMCPMTACLGHPDHPFDHDDY